MIVSFWNCPIVHETYIDQICLITHVQVMYNRRFIQMCEFGHVVRFVEFCWVDLVGLVLVYITLLEVLALMFTKFGGSTYTAIVALHKQAVLWQLLHYPSSNKGFLRILEPDVMLAGKVVFTLDPVDLVPVLDFVGLYKLRSKCSGCRGIVPLRGRSSV